MTKRTFTAFVIDARTQPGFVITSAIETLAKNRLSDLFGAVGGDDAPASEKHAEAGSNANPQNAS